MSFLFCPEHIWEDESLSLHEKSVYGVILGLTKKEGYCYATNAFIGKNIGVSGDRVKRIISKLNAKGVLRIEVERSSKKSGPLSNGWFTRRKIYVFETDAPPMGGKNNPQVGGENDAYIVKNYSKESEGAPSLYDLIQKTCGPEVGRLSQLFGVDPEFVQDSLDNMAAHYASLENPPKFKDWKPRFTRWVTDDIIKGEN